MLRRALAVTVALATVVVGLLRSAVRRPGPARARPASEPAGRGRAHRHRRHQLVRRRRADHPEPLAAPARRVVGGPVGALGLLATPARPTAGSGLSAGGARRRTARGRRPGPRRPARAPSRPAVVNGNGLASGRLPGGRRRRALRHPSSGCSATPRRPAGSASRRCGRAPRSAGPGATGRIEQTAVWSRPQMLEDLNGCPVTLVDVGSLRDPDDVADGEQRRGVAAGAADRDRHADRPGHRGRAERRRLRRRPRSRMPGAASGCGSSSRAARTSAPACSCRSSTRQKGLAQAPDVTATVLSVVGLPVPDAVAGAPLTSDPAPDNSRAPGRGPAHLPRRLRRGQPRRARPGRAVLHGVRLRAAGRSTCSCCSSTRAGWGPSAPG